MIPPKGYRLATQEDLRAGVEVLIPAILDADGDAAVKHPNHSRQWIGSDCLPGLALIRDEAEPDRADLGRRTLSAALRERDEARAAVTGEDVAALRAGLIAETERADTMRERLRTALGLTAADPDPEDWHHAALYGQPHVLRHERQDAIERAEKAEAALAAVSVVICPLTGDFSGGDPVSAAHWIRGRLGAAERAEAERDAMRKATDPDVSVLRAQLATATEMAMEAASDHGALREQIEMAAVLCGIDATGMADVLSGLIDRARGGGR